MMKLNFCKSKSIMFILLIFCAILSCAAYDNFDDFSDITGEISIAVYSSPAITHQSAAIYSNYAFFVTDKRAYIYVYDISNCQVIDTIKLSAVNSKTPSGYILYHCNQSSFSPMFYSSDDKFPLLYISQRASKDMRCFAEVYRIIVNENGECQKFSVKLIQKLYFPVMNEQNALGNVNVVFDAECKKMYTYSRNNDTAASNHNVCRISCFDIPPVNESKLFLSDEDIVSSFSIDCSAVNMQGACIHNGLIYIGQGISTPILRIVSLETNSLIASYDIKKRGYNFEPEGCFWYNNNLMLCSKKNIYNVTVN